MTATPSKAVAADSGVYSLYIAENAATTAAFGDASFAGGVGYGVRKLADDVTDMGACRIFASAGGELGQGLMVKKMMDRCGSSETWVTASK